MDSTRNVIFFTPYIGDTMVSCAFARRLYRLTHKETCVAQIGEEHVYTENFTSEAPMLLTMYGGEIGELMELGKGFSPEAQLQKIYYGGRFQYYYTPGDDYLLRLEALVGKILDKLFPHKTTFYILHYTHAYAYFAKEALKRGHEVRGYILDAGWSLKMINHKGIAMDADIWTDEFIGQRLARLFLGCDLTIQDFYVCHGPTDYIKPNRVTLFPGTRGNGLPSIGHWEEDIEYLTRQGYDVAVAYYDKEDGHIADYLLREIGNVLSFPNMSEMIKIITESEFIICNDSSSFHLAWYYGVPAIVKQKGGFNYEWTPEWVQAPAYQFLPPVMMYEEEYNLKLHKATEGIRTVLREGGPSRRLEVKRGSV